jgi:hypothetical protein
MVEPKLKRAVAVEIRLPRREVMSNEEVELVRDRAWRFSDAGIDNS